MALDPLESVGGSGGAGFGLDICDDLDVELGNGKGEIDEDEAASLSLRALWGSVSDLERPITIELLLEDEIIDEGEVEDARIFLNFFVAKGKMTCSDKEGVRKWQLKAAGAPATPEPGDIARYREILAEPNPDCPDDLAEYAWEVATFSF